MDCNLRSLSTLTLQQGVLLPFNNTCVQLSVIITASGPPRSQLAGAVSWLQISGTRLLLVLIMRRDAAENLFKHQRRLSG